MHNKRDTITIQINFDWRNPHGKDRNTHIRIEPEVKKDADYIFKAIGITTADAVNISAQGYNGIRLLLFEVTAPKYNVQRPWQQWKKPG